MKRFFLRHRGLHLWFLLCAAVLAAFYALRPVRAVMNAVTAVSCWLRRAVGALCALFPFSVTELFYAAAILGTLVYLVFSVRAVVRRRGERRRTAYRRALGLINAALTLWASFCLIWGANYYADGFCDRVGLNARPVSAEALTRVTLLFADGLNGICDGVPRDENGVFRVSAGELLAYAPHAYDAISAEYPVLAGTDTPPKAMLFSRLMSRLGYSGIYFPFLGESSVNVDAPTCFLPSVITHELGHRRGFASEQECNFIGILAAVRCENAAYRYSGLLCGYAHLSGALYRADPDAWRAVRETLSPAVLADLAYDRAYWAQFEGPVGDAADAVYDAYLRSYGQTDGLRSYGAVVDLLVAYFDG